MMKKFMFFSALILCFSIAPFLAQATTDSASEMIVGVWSLNQRYITFGEYNGHPLIWRVLEVKDNDPDFIGKRTAFLLLDDVLQDGNGNVELVEFGLSNSFPDSEIVKWLNDDTSGFLTKLNAYQPGILDTTYGPDSRKWPDNAPDHRRWAGGSELGISKVFLLSVGEALDINYFINETDQSVDDNKSSWWLRSPGYERDIATSVLHFGGVAMNGPFVHSRNGVRPSLKISLSSHVFESVPVSYGLTVKTDDGNNPIGGAKISLAPSSGMQIMELFSNSVGIARFSRVTPGTYTVTVHKPGYITKQENITVPAVEIPTISLTPDSTVLSYNVKFGRYNGEPIEWDVLDIVDGKALLLAGALFERYFDASGKSVWADSSLRAYLNSNSVGDFLQEDNFTASEAAAINNGLSVTGDSVFLLSRSEVFRYLPDASMRFFDNKEWLTRTPANGEDVIVIGIDGDYGGGIPAFSRDVPGWSRPAIWVDLSKLIYDVGTNTLVP